MVDKSFAKNAGKSLVKTDFLIVLAVSAALCVGLWVWMNYEQPNQNENDNYIPDEFDPDAGGHNDKPDGKSQPPH